jgi:hypothetical protein
MVIVGGVDFVGRFGQFIPLGVFPAVTAIFVAHYIDRASNIRWPLLGGVAQGVVTASVMAISAHIVFSQNDWDPQKVFGAVGTVSAVGFITGLGVGWLVLVSVKDNLEAAGFKGIQSEPE